MSVPCVFLRDDDVWIDDDVFLELAALFKMQGIPVIYGVIPMRLTEQMARVLREAKERDPGLLDIVQHGYAHQNYALPGEGKYEFGPLRTYAQQYEDIACGIKIMRRFFGRTLTPGFIPPFHADDINTIKAIEALKIPLYSARKQVVWPRKKFVDFPAQVYLNGYERDGTLRALDFRGLLSKIEEIVVPGKVNGMVYRHHLIRSTKEMKAMKAFVLVLARLSEQGKLRIVLFSELLNAYGRNIKRSSSR